MEKKGQLSAGLGLRTDQELDLQVKKRVVVAVVHRRLAVWLVALVVPVAAGLGAADVPVVVAAVFLVVRLVAESVHCFGPVVAAEAVAPVYRLGPSC